MTVSANRQGRRPRDRRDQLVRLAADLFHRHGFHGVGVNDIASAAGITGPALYRHFPSKQALLVHVLQTGVNALCAVGDEALGLEGATPEKRLAELTSRLADIAVEHRSVTALWRWEGRHLPAGEAAEVRRRGGTLISAWVRELRAMRPELSRDEAELRCWAALSVFASVADHRVSLPKRRFAPFLAALANTVLAAPLTSTVDSCIEPGSGADLAPTKREQLLSSATALFRRHGFHAVSVEDIGQACGLAAASVYRHFPSKLDLLAEGCKRMADRLAQNVQRALSASDGPEQAVTALLKSYVDTALQERDLISVYISEMDNLSRRERGELIRLQRAFVSRWVELLAQVRDDLDEPSARVAVHAALTIVNDLVRTERFAVRSGLAAELVELGEAILHTPFPTESG
jgi:AcrR family transcriptional regulator